MIVNAGIVDPGGFGCCSFEPAIGPDGKAITLLRNEVITVDIDIKPGSFPNSINTKSMGLVAVAVLGSATFDVTTIDVTILAFGPAGATPAHDLTDPVVYADHFQDVNTDALTDLVSHYVQKQTGLVVGDISACLNAGLLGGGSIQDCDSVRIVK